MEGESRIIYKKRSKERYLKKTQNLEDLTKINELFTQYLSSESKKEMETFFDENNFIKIYNFLFLVNDKKIFIDLYSYINQTLIKFINQKLKSIEENKNNIEYVIQTINYINIIEKKIKNIKNILITCTSRFDSDLIKKMNDNLDISSFFKENDNFIKFIENSENIFLNLLTKEEKDKQKLYISIFQFMNIAKIISYQKKLEIFTDKIVEIIIKKSNYNKFYEEMKQELINKISEENNFQTNFINTYFDSINNELNNNYIIFTKIFGEKDANKYKEKIIKIYIFDKLINDIFKNEKLLKIIISEKNYDILKLIESKTRQSLKLTKEFIKSLFNILLNELDNKIIPPKENNDIAKGLEYIQKKLQMIMDLNSIFKEVFNENKKVQLKFHETLIKIISSKKFGPFEYLLSIYVNENLYKEKMRNKFIFNKAFIQLLTNLNNNEIFFKFHRKYIIKRISNNIFNFDIESAFQNYLKKNVENRYMNDINRIFKDLNDSKFINDNNKNGNYFYLFSFDTLDKEYDLVQIIDLEKQNYEIFNPFKICIDTYNQVYPKRKITLSQIFSTFEVIFLNKYNFIINYVQLYILQIILKQKNDNYCITYEKLCSLIPIKPENKVYLKIYLTSLIEMNILINQSNNIIKNDFNSNDIIQINMNFETNKSNIICFAKPNNILRNMLKNINKEDSEQKEFESKNYKVNAIKENAGKIIDCVIIQILKALPKGEKISEKELIINLIKHKIIEDLQLRKYKVIETMYIKERLENLNKREIINREDNDNVISYSYY